MSVLFVNDPTFDQVPPVGGVPVLLAVRTACGEAVSWSPGGDTEALTGFLGDEFVALDGAVYQRHEDGSLRPVMWQKQSVVLVKPPAGGIFTVTKDLLTQQYAIVSAVEAPVDENEDGTVDSFEELGYPEIVAMVKGWGLTLPVPAAKKSVLIAMLRDAKVPG